eukprot:468750-Amphidinium_carterae.1
MLKDAEQHGHTSPPLLRCRTIIMTDLEDDKTPRSTRTQVYDTSSTDWTRGVHTQFEWALSIHCIITLTDTSLLEENPFSEM